MSDWGPAERGWDCGHWALQELMLSAPKGPQTSPRNLQEVPPPGAPRHAWVLGLQLVPTRAHTCPARLSAAEASGMLMTKTRATVENFWPNYVEIWLLTPSAPPGAAPPLPYPGGLSPLPPWERYRRCGDGTRARQSREPGQQRRAGFALLDVVC